MSEVIRLTAQQLDFLERSARSGQPLAWIMVLGTEGSTYSKSGQVMLVGADGEMHGMLSGGCLEGDLVERARRAIAIGKQEIAEYDLINDDELFGLGVGCEGVMRILVQQLTILGDVELDSIPVDAQVLGPRRILLLGGGLDADPIVEIAVSMGWRVVVADRKPVNLERLGSRCDVVDNSNADFAGLVANGAFDAAIVKNHNLVRDREHLEMLAATDVPFIGLLGPPHRRDRILSGSEGLAETLGDRLHGPVGTRIGGRGPAAVALEIAAELQAFFTDG
jgi:xanthine dehydrogenase accessory factor